MERSAVGAQASATGAAGDWKQQMVQALQQRTSMHADAVAQVHTKKSKAQVRGAAPSTCSSTASSDVRSAVGSSGTSQQQHGAAAGGAKGFLHPASTLGDFEVGRVIGTGTFGRVSVARHKASGTTVVVKSLSKAACIKDGQVRHVLDEKAILAYVSTAGHPFLVNLRGAFQDTNCLHLVLDFVAGGDFFSFLREYPARFGSKMREDHARFYTAQIILGLEYLHGMDIVFRDLKPENLLMDSTGYIRITDFGFAKQLHGGCTYTTCGTPEYLAPEVIRAQAYTAAVDWWSLGCVVYEMLQGFPPFYAGGDPIKTYKKTLAHEIVFPNHWSDLAVNLISGLLQVDPQARLGVAGGTERLKAHPWFQGFDWKLMLHKRYQPPFKPRVASADDTSNFDDFATLAPAVHPFPLTAEHQKLFSAF